MTTTYVLALEVDWEALADDPTDLPSLVRGMHNHARGREPALVETPDVFIGHALCEVLSRWFARQSVTGNGTPGNTNTYIIESLTMHRDNGIGVTWMELRWMVPLD